MKINEVIGKTKKVLDIQPQTVARQTRVNNLVSQIATSDQQQQPSEMDKVMATRQYANMKKQAQQNYTKQLRLQLANAQRQAT
jgi:hypothetical protein